MAEGRMFQIFATGSGEPAGSRLTVSSVALGSPDSIHLTSAETSASDPLIRKFIDYVTLDAHNQDSVPQTLHLLVGAGGQEIVVDIPPRMPPILLLDRHAIADAQEIVAYASSTNKIHLGVRVERVQVAV